MRSTLLLLSTVLVFTGCSTFTKEQIYAVRATGISPNVVSKLEHDRVLLPADIIQLRRYRVPDSVPIRSLDEVGVDYIPQREDLRRMRSADVHSVVIDQVIIAGQEFANDQVDRPNFAWGLSIPFFSWYPYYGYGWGQGNYYYGRPYYRGGYYGNRGYYYGNRGYYANRGYYGNRSYSGNRGHSGNYRGYRR